MLTPFTKAIKRTGNASEDDDEDEADIESEDEDENDDNEVEAEREAFDDTEVEDAMREVSEVYNVSEAEAKVARSSLTKVCANTNATLMFPDAQQ